MPQPPWAVYLPSCREELLEARVAAQAVEVAVVTQGASVVVARGERPLERVERLGVAALQRVGAAEVVERRASCRGRGGGARVRLDRLVDAAGEVEHQPEVVPGDAVIVL